MSFVDSMTLAEAREHLRELVGDGHRCPTCSQYAKVYRRTIHSTMARELIEFHRAAGTEWAYLPDTSVQRGGDMTKCRYWGLIEEDQADRGDGSKRNGWWRVTPLGAEWIAARATVPKYARVYDGRLLGLEGDEVTIRQALGKKFNYADLMGRDHELRIEQARHEVSPEPVEPVGETLFDTSLGFDDVCPQPANGISDEWGGA